MNVFWTLLAVYGLGALFLAIVAMEADRPYSKQSEAPIYLALGLLWPFLVLSWFIGVVRGE